MGGGGWGMFEPQEFFFRYQIHRMQIWLTSRPARVSVRESEASEASRVLFWLRVLAIESIDMVCFELLRAWAPPKRRFYSSWNYLNFPEIFHKECNGFMRFGAAMGSTLQRKRKCTRFTCFRREDSRKYLNERIFERDVTVLWCLHCLLFTKQKVNILDNGSIHFRL